MAGPSPWATRWEPAGPSSRPPSSTSWSGAKLVTACRRCARAAASRTLPSSSASEPFPEFLSAGLGIAHAALGLFRFPSRRSGSRLEVRGALPGPAELALQALRLLDGVPGLPFEGPALFAGGGRPPGPPLYVPLRGSKVPLGLGGLPVLR